MLRITIVILLFLSLPALGDEKADPSALSKEAAERLSARLRNVGRFEAPADHMGEISKLISNKRGQLLDMQQEGEFITVLGKLPVGEMFGLSNDLRSATGGRGSSSLVDQNFERMPGELQNKIVRQIRERKGLKLE